MREINEYNENKFGEIFTMLVPPDKFFDNVLRYFDLYPTFDKCMQIYVNVEHKLTSEQKSKLMYIILRNCIRYNNKGGLGPFLPMGLNPYITPNMFYELSKHEKNKYMDGAYNYVFGDPKNYPDPEKYKSDAHNDYAYAGKFWILRRIRKYNMETKEHHWVEAEMYQQHYICPGCQDEKK